VAHYCRYTGLDITRFVKFYLYCIQKLLVSQPGISLQCNYSIWPSSPKKRITAPNECSVRSTVHGYSEEVLLGLLCFTSAAYVAQKYVKWKFQQYKPRTLSRMNFLGIAARVPLAPVSHNRIKINHQPDVTIFQFIILTFIYSSICYGRFPAHHQFK